MKIDDVEEEPAFFPFGDLMLAGILTAPSTPNGVVVVIPFGSALYSSAGPNRLRAHLARLVAASGYHAFRFDYQGVGESEGQHRPPDMENPYCEEIAAACAWLATQGLSRVIIVANCFGAWSSLMAAPSISGLEAVALVNSPVTVEYSTEGGRTVVKRVVQTGPARIQEKTVTEKRID